MAMLASPSAWAEEIDTDPAPDEFQQEVERTAAEYESALAQVDSAKKALEENRERVRELEATIPVQQARGDAAARELYKIEQQSGGVLELLLSAGDFHEFLTNLEYVSRAADANRAEINRLAVMKMELDATQSALKQAKRDADTHAEEASSALDAAKEARKEAQRRAQEEARRQAEEAAAAAAAAAAEAEAAAAASSSAAAEPTSDSAESADKSDASASSDGASASEKSADKSGEDAKADDKASEGTSSPAPTDDGANWDADQAAFINQWASRIDAYLDGSPLAGQGKTFASAAWTYGVDPRWSPAISYIESTKGADCFASHNAWGWGSVSWGSWEEAINAHVGGLARGYGYTISIEAAQKYCPPNWQHWYDVTLAQMNTI